MLLQLSKLGVEKLQFIISRGKLGSDLLFGTLQNILFLCGMKVLLAGATLTGTRSTLRIFASSIHHASFTIQSARITRKGRDETVVDNTLSLTNATGNLITLTRKFGSGRTFEGSVSTTLRHDGRTWLGRETSLTWESAAF
jgi:hypothetical protein